MPTIEIKTVTKGARMSERKLRRVKKAVDDLVAVKQKLDTAQKKTASSLRQNFIDAMQRTGQQIRLARGPLDGIASRFTTLTAILKSGNGPLAAVVTTFGLFTVGVGLTASALFNFQREIEPLLVRLQVMTKSATGAKEALGFLRGLANDLGLNMMTLTEQFSQFSVAATTAGFSLDETKKIFTGVSTAVSALNLNNEQATRVFLALEQMVSKGKVSMEELRRQLGNALPGAVNIAAQSIGVTTEELFKMVESGELLTKDFLPKFAAQLQTTFGDLSGINTLNKEINKMGTALFDIKEALLFGLGLDKVFLESMVFLRETLDSIADTAAKVASIFSSTPFLTSKQRATIGNLPPGSEEAKTLLRLQKLKDLRSSVMGNEDTVFGIERVPGFDASIIGGYTEEIGKLQEKMRQLHKKDAAISLLGPVEGLTSAKTDISGGSSAYTEKQLKSRAKFLTMQMKQLGEFRKMLAQDDKKKSTSFSGDFAEMQMKQEGALRNMIAREDKKKASAAAKFADTQMKQAEGLRGMIVKEDLKRQEEALRALNKEIEEGARITQEAREPFTVYGDSLKRLNELYSKGLINQETFTLALNNEIDTLIKADPILNAIGNAAGDMADSLVDAFLTGADAMESFKNIVGGLAKTIIAEFIKIAIIKPIISSIFGGFSGLFGGGGFVSGADSAAAGGWGTSPQGEFGMAGGGPVKAGVPINVGERGQEVFVPHSDGTIISNDQMKRGGAGGNTYYIDARGADKGQLVRLEAMIQQINGTLETRSFTFGEEMKARRLG